MTPDDKTIQPDWFGPTRYSNIDEQNAAPQGETPCDSYGQVGTRCDPSLPPALAAPTPRQIVDAARAEHWRAIEQGSIIAGSLDGWSLAEKALSENADLRSQVTAHEAVRDACFEALPECQVWGDVPGHITALRQQLEAEQDLRASVQCEADSLREDMHALREQLAEVKNDNDGLRASVVAIEVHAARLRTIEHAAWHLLDDSETRMGSGEIVVERKQFDALAALLPEEHPTVAAAKGAVE